MSSSKSSRRRLEGSVKIKLHRSAKESSANGTENSEEELINLNDSGSEDSAASKEYKPKIRKESQTLNKSVLALPDDLKKLIDRVLCCSCGKQLNVMNAGAVRKHPWLKVVTCKKCYKFLRSGPFTRDDDGTDEQCRWCGDGGRLYGCDFCHNCFCRSCIKRNLGRSEATKMEEDDGSKWHCYMCKPKKIRGLVSDCSKILDYIATEEKKDKEKEERRVQREKEKAAAHAAKVKEEKRKNGDSEKKGDKGSAKKGFPAPKDKSQIAVPIKSEKKEEKVDKKPDMSIDKKETAPELIVLDDSPLKISQHHRARAYKPDQTTGVKQVQKATNGVLEVTVGPKNSKPIVNITGGRPQQAQPNRPLLAGMLGQNLVVSGLNRGIANKRPPPNDLQVLKNNILPLNIDAAIDKMMPMTQSFNLSLNSVKTDIAIAKLSQVNMYQARQRACSQIRNSLEYYLNGIREVWGVQLVSNSTTPSAEGSGEPATNLLKAAMGLPNTDNKATLSNNDSKVTSTPIKSKESLPDPKLNESVIPIEIDSPTPVKEATEEVMEVEDNESDDAVCIDKPKKETENDKEPESAEKETEKDKSEEPESRVDDKKSAEADDKVNGENSVTEMSDAEDNNEDNIEDNTESEGDETKNDEHVKSKEDGDTSGPEMNSSKDKDTEKTDEIDEDNSEKDDDIDTKKSETVKYKSGKDKKSSKKAEKKSGKEDKCDAGEESGAEEDNLVSENTAAELELLKEMADELNEKEDSDDEEEAQPRRSSRSRKVAESETKDDEDNESPKRRSSRQRTKPEEKSDKKSDKDGDKAKTERQSRKTRTTESGKSKEKAKDVDEEENNSTEEEPVKTKSKKLKDKSKSKDATEEGDLSIEEEVKTKSKKSKEKTKDAVEEENMSTEEEQVNTKSKKGSDSHKKSDKKSKVAFESDEDTVEEEKEEKPRSKRSDKAKDEKTKSKHNKHKDSGEDTEEESVSKEKTKGKDKESKHAHKSKESKRKPSKELEDDDSTEVEGEKPEKQTKKKSPVKDKKKSPSKKEVQENIGVDDDIPTEESDTSDSSDESFEEFGKKRKTRKKKEKTEESKGTRRSSRRATRQVGKKSTEEEPTDSDPDFDKDLEKEIKSLSKETRLSRKKKSEKDSKRESKQTKEDKKAKDKKKSAKQEVSAEEDEEEEEESDMSSAVENDSKIELKQTKADKKAKDKKKSAKQEESAEEEEVEEDSDMSSAVEMPSDDPEESEDDTDNLSASQLKKLKQAGKAALEASDDEDDVIPENISSDSSDPEVSFPKLSTPKKGKKHAMDVSDDSDFITPKKKKRIRSKLLDTRISDSDSDSGKKGKKGKKGKRKRKGNSDDFSELSDEEENRTKGKGKKRRRIKKMDSSDEEKIKEPGEDDEVSGSDEEGTPGGHLKRKQIRKVIGSGKLKDATKAAQKAEEMRRKRIEERQKEYNTYVEVEGGEEEAEAEELPDGTEREHATPVKADTDSIAKILGSPRKVPVTTKCVLEMDKEKKKTIIEIDRTLVKKLKPHQVEAVRFMYNCCVETIETKDKGSGCILAHCMGLGKTLSVVTFIHTLLSNQKLTKMSKCLVVCPLNTVLNWVNEFEIWLDDVDFEIEVYEMSRVKQNFERAQMLKEWSEGGAGVMILGYDMYRNLASGTHCRNAKQKKIFYSTLADPGPDLTVCDEGHILKNDQTSLSKAMMKIKSAKRVVLTGTPLQNNLGEYHCMVNFVKPSLLGTRKEFNNRFNNPITNGQCKDSTAFDVKLMKRRAHILHELLAGCVQRKDYSALTKFLPPKFEYVISVRLAPVQMTLYEKYLEMTQGEETASKGARLFRDYQALMRIWTHPWVLKLDEIRQENKRQFDDTESEDSFVDDSDGKDSFVNDSDSDSLVQSTTELSASDSESESNAKGKKKKKKTRSGRGKASSSSDESKKENPDEVVKKWTSKRRGNEEGAGSSWMDYMGYGGAKKEKDDTVTNEWWAEYVKETDESRLDISGKLVLLFEILKMCEDIGDKVLVFSQSLLSLDIIEDFLMKVDEAQTLDGPDGDKPSTSDEKDKASTSGEKDKASTSGEKDKASTSGEKDKASTSGEKKSDSADKTDADGKSDEASGSGEGTEVKEKTEAEKNKERLAKYGKNWTKGADYFRMDGSTNSQNRKTSQDMFNDPENYRARLFLISTKAGSLGINLVSANRVIIFDASWNPSHDIQSIFRVYRFGQVKPVYVYRFLAQGTMEEKIYERQVTKQSLSQRVVDEHQIARHFTSNDLQELYKFQPDRLDDPEKKDRPLPMLPKDHMLAELMTNDSEWVVTYHEHDSLLENVVEQELNEEEKKAAWEDYENEKKGLNRVQQMMGGSGLNPAVYATQQMSMQNLLLQGQANLGQAAVLQIVQDLKLRFPNLPPEVFQQRVQAVLRQVLTQQIMQQSAMQRQQVEQQRLNELNRLNQMKQQIQRQQAMINGPQSMYSLGQQSLLAGSLSGNMSGLRQQTLNQLSVNRSNAPIDLTGQTPSTKK